MQEADLRKEDDSTNDGSSYGEPNLNIDFRVDGNESVSSDRTDPAVQDLVQFLNKQSASINKEIDSALSSTDSADEDSFSEKKSLVSAKQSSESGDSSWEKVARVDKFAAESNTLVAATRAEKSDPKTEIRKLNDKVKLLLNERKSQKDTIEAQKHEIASLRGVVKGLEDRHEDHSRSLEKRYQEEAESHRADLVLLQGEMQKIMGGANDSQRSALQNLDLQQRTLSLEKELSTTKGRLEEFEGANEEKDRTIRGLEAKVDGLLKQNDTLVRTIDLQNAKISRLTEASLDITPGSRKATTKPNNFEADFAALDAALGHIDDATVKGGSPSSPDKALLEDYKSKLSQRDNEIAKLLNNVKRLEALAFERSRRESSASSDVDDSKNQAQLRFMKETSDEQAHTIQLQKSTINSLKEEVQLLTRQLSEFQNDNQINVDKQKKLSQTLQTEQQKLQEQSDKLARDREEFKKHLAAFKEARKEVFQGAIVTIGGGVPKSRYRTLRHKRDKYKRKDYRKVKDINAMQKRLLQHVEQLEVEDSQSSSEGTATADKSVDSYASTSSKSVQLVHDSSSEAPDSEDSK